MISDTADIYIYIIHNDISLNQYDIYDIYMYIIYDIYIYTYMLSQYMKLRITDRQVRVGQPSMILVWEHCGATAAGWCRWRVVGGGRTFLYDWSSAIPLVELAAVDTE